MIYMGVNLDYKPRRKINTDYAARVFYGRMIWDEAKPGGLISEIIVERTGGKDLGHRIPLLLHGYLRHMNGRTGTTFPSLSKLAQDMGYSGSGHDLTKCRNLLESYGFLTHAKGKGRTVEYALSLPVALIGKYENANGDEYEDITDHLNPDTLQGDEHKETRREKKHVNKEALVGGVVEDPWGDSLIP